MKNITYSMSKASYFLGVSRQQAYNRKTGESWPVDDNGNVPSSVIKTSRDLELDRLRSRINELEQLEIQQAASDKKLAKETNE